MILETGVADEVSVLQVFGVQVDVAALIEEINNNPGQYQIHECETSRLLECNRNDFINHEALSQISDSRLNQPLLVAVIDDYEWVIDGNHRLLRRAELAKDTTSFIPIPGEELGRFISQFSLRR